MATETSNRELSIEKLLNAPIELVWEVWTKPEHIKHWWGPNGFTNTISKMDVRPGGEWEFIMHGPDGTDYKNKHVFTEIIKHERIVMEHVTAPKFTTVIKFIPKGKQTLIQWTGTFQSPEQLKQVIEVFKADVGLTQNIERMEFYLKTNF